MNNLTKMGLLLLIFICVTVYLILFSGYEYAAFYAVATGTVCYILPLFICETNDQRYRRKTRRVAIHAVGRSESQKYLDEGWVIALPEENLNHNFGVVYLERRVGK